MKKILGLTVAALLVMALVGGGTWAYFSDVETSSGNVFTAGTLDLGLDTTAAQDPTGSITSTFAQTDWAPGGTKGGTIYVNNEGSIAMTSVTVTFFYDSVNDGTLSSVSGSPWDTDPYDYLDKMIIATTVTWDSVTDATLEGKTLAELKTLGAYDLGGLAADTEKALYILWTFSIDATNGCQGDDVDVTLTFTGSQN